MKLNDCSFSSNHHSISCSLSWELKAIVKHWPQPQLSSVTRLLPSLIFCSQHCFHNIYGPQAEILMADYKDGGTQLISWNATVSSASHWLSPASGFSGCWLVNGGDVTETCQGGTVRSAHKVCLKGNNSLVNNSHYTWYTACCL